MLKEALLYEKLDNKLVHCYLCAHHCRISEGGFGFCGVRQNKGGALYTHVYGKLIAANVDPIEKKPLYHFFPGSKSFSVATVGCNFHCGFCQNWEISQRNLREDALVGEDYSPEDVLNAALKYECKNISYTYTEPTVFFEFALDSAKLTKEKGLYNSFVTNGFMTKECLLMIRPYLDAVNVDLKFFKEESYKKNCAGALAPVLDSIRLMKELAIWIEVTTLIIPDENDSEEELGNIAKFIAGLDKNIPWHISRFHPDYKFTQYPATSDTALKKAQELGRKAGLNYIYVGNVWGWGNDTYCPACKKLLIKREGFGLLEGNIRDCKCVFCGEVIPGVF